MNIFRLATWVAGLCLQTLPVALAQNQAPQVDAGPDQSVALYEALYLQGSVSDDGLPTTTLTTLWSLDQGPGEVAFDHAAQLDTRAFFTETGLHFLKLSADDGELEATDEIQVTVTEPKAPSIELLSPDGGEVWLVGSKQIIRWTTVNLSDVSLAYSSDEGASWTTITQSVDDQNPSWGQYSWLVPNTPSRTCRLEVAGYFSETADRSQSNFEIATPATAGGCSSLPSQGHALLTLLLIGLVLALRARPGARRRNLTL